MSMDSAGIFCTNCDYESREVYRPILVRYVRDDGKTIEVSRTKGWCYHCNDYADIEKVDQVILRNILQEHHQQAAALTQQLVQLQTGLLATLYNRFKIKNVAWQLQQSKADQANIELLLEFFQQRVAKPRCLKCFSEQTTPFSFHPDHHLSENFTHHCGGHLRIAYDDIGLRLNFRRTVFVLNTEGELLYKE